MLSAHFAQETMGPSIVQRKSWTFPLLNVCAGYF